MTEEKPKIPNKKPNENSLKNLMPPWKPGEVVNLKGRGKGVRNFKTIFEEAAREVSKSLKLGNKPDAVQIELVKRGIKGGLSGNFNFYKDLMDRLYGKVEDKVDVNLTSLNELEISLKQLAGREQKQIEEKNE